MDSDLQLPLRLLDELCDKLDDSGIDGNVIERDSHGEPYANIWYGSYEDRPRLSSEMFTVVVTDYSLYSSPHGCYEIKPPNKYADYFDSTFIACRSRSVGFYVMGSDQIVRVVKYLFNIEKLKENKMADWEIEEKILKDDAKKINNWINSCFTAEIVRVKNTQEPLILVRDKDQMPVFEIYYDCKNKMYSVVPRGALGGIADEKGYVRNSIHMGFGFAMISHSFLKDIYTKWKDEQKSEIKKENKMSNFTLATKLFGKLKRSGINYKFENGIYNPEKVIITMKFSIINYEIAFIRSIPYSEDSDFAYRVIWTSNVPSDILARNRIKRVQEYEWSDNLIDDILLVEKELKRASNYITTMNDLPTIKAVDVIFNDPATIIIWADGSKTVVKAENEKFDPEKGLAMAISKKVLGNKHDYYEVFKRYVGRYEKKQGKKAKKNK